MYHMIGLFVVGMVAGLIISRYMTYDRFEGFDEGFDEGFMNSSMCDNCQMESPCGCQAPKPRIPSRPADDARKNRSNRSRTKQCDCKQPNMSNYVLKASIPPCPAVPDMSNYILKSECPPVPDLSNYVLKSSIPRQSPVILDCSKCNKPKGDCPPCPRPRCPEVKCPEPTKCPTCAPCPRMSCPPAKISCKSVPDQARNESLIRPYMAPLSYHGFGTN
jgi:hypothetical protein